MSKILVLGSVNVDRVWRLDRPLRVGGRNLFGAVERRIGGGGFTTGAALLTLGHQVSIATSLGDDEDGRRCLETLRQLGFGTTDVSVQRRPTTPIEIFVDPFGERTILASGGTEAEPVTQMPTGSADLAYVATRKVDKAVLSRLSARMDVIAQIPLDVGEQRPATVLIGSSSDLSVAGLRNVFASGRRIAGPSLQYVVLTDGARDVRVWDRRAEQRIPVDPRPTADDTTGAGDVFAAGFIDAYLRGDEPRDAVRHGNQIAGLFLADRTAFVGPSGHQETGGLDPSASRSTRPAPDPARRLRERRL
jgi:sugar/nucleoside kinase (ribokinase family)